MKEAIEIDFKVGGEQLAKVLIYYGLIPEVSEDEPKIVCPFHGDVNPSMKINLVDGTFYCFGCGASGDAMTFVRMVNKEMSDLDACKEYFKILKSDKVNKIVFSERKPKVRGTDVEKWNEAHDYYYGLKSTDWKHDLDDEVKSSYEYMNKRGFTADTLNKCKAKITFNRQYPIIFPMYDNGKFKGWVCRTTNKRTEALRKYLYNEGFSRATTLVGEYGGSNTVILVEGYMDRLKFKQFGAKKVAAILGWKITTEQIKKLKDAGVTRVVSALDNDVCGIKGTKYLQKFFDVTRFQYERNCKDAGEFTKDSYERMIKDTRKQYKIDTKGGACQ